MAKRISRTALKRELKSEGVRLPHGYELIVRKKAKRTTAKRTKAKRAKRRKR